MFDIKFDDVVENKYIYVGQFVEGLAVVQNRNELWGYINKKGEEVIPCKFSKAYDFSEGMALVMGSAGYYGYINETGEFKIPCIFHCALPFSEGLAAVQECGLWGYIDKKSNKVIPNLYADARCFKEGFAAVESNGYWRFINRENIMFGRYHWAKDFVNGRAIVEDSNNDVYSMCNRTKMQKLDSKCYNMRSVSDENCGLIRFTTAGDKCGYMNNDFDIIIQPIYEYADDFKDDVAIVSFGRGDVGFITKEGIYTCFSRTYQYKTMHYFSEGLAKVQNRDSKVGFINKSGKEVIPCKYAEADDFSEGVAGVMDENGELYYINKKGKKVITLPKIYKSTLKFGDIEIPITADNEKEFNQKKLAAIDELQKQVMETLAADFDKSQANVKQKINVLNRKK